MYSAYYELYLKWVFDLCTTLVIKSEDTALAQNEYLITLGQSVDEADPASWRYYRHLAGQYHATDEIMTVRSLDTGETIAFTRAMLAEHRTTQREYTIRSRYYRELLERYPDQERLINGILHPVDLTTAVAAQDHTILYYDTTLVESNETNLIPQLQQFITLFFDRWDIHDYRIGNELYPTALLGMLFALLPKVVLNIRLANCKTNYAHSYHIRQYLTSMGRLDPYFDFMTLKQRLFLYRNIEYINQNNGKQDTFDWLTEHLLTERGFPLERYTLRQNQENQLENLYPEVELERSSVNGLQSLLGRDLKSVDQVLEIENPLASRNQSFYDETRLEALEAMERSSHSSLRTKVLESSVLDLTGAEPFTLNEVLLHHWIYFSHIDHYKALIRVTHPATNEVMTLSSREAFLLWLYLYNDTHHLSLTHIPVLVAKRVVRLPRPTRTELLGFVNSEVVHSAWVDEALGLAADVRPAVSIAGFRETCTAIWQSMLRHRDLAVYRQRRRAYSQILQMVDRFYMDFKIEAQIGTPYADWFAERKIDLSQLDQIEKDLLATELYRQATGEDLSTTKTLREVHQAMVGLMEHLSSYNVQYIPLITSATMKILDWPHLRYDNFQGESNNRSQYNLPLASHLNPRSKQRYRAGPFYRGLNGTIDNEELREALYLEVPVSHWMQPSPPALAAPLRTQLYHQLREEPPVALESLVSPGDVPGYLPWTPLGLESIFTTTTSDESALTSADLDELRNRV